MRATVVYESMYGNTRKIAEAIAEGLHERVDAVPVSKAIVDRPAETDLLVVGGPTHAWSMSRPRTRSAAVQAAAKPDSGLTVEPGAEGNGLREFLAYSIGNGRCAAAFDTRVKSRFSGRASAAINHVLARHGFEVIAAPQGFYVTRDNRLVDGELDRARDWGRRLAERFESQPLDGSRV
jgi:hypothetical protein